jgi:hypothetical protein
MLSMAVDVKMTEDKEPEVEILAGLLCHMPSDGKLACLV